MSNALSTLLASHHPGASLPEPSLRAAETFRELLAKRRIRVPSPRTQSEVATDDDVIDAAYALRRVAARMRTDPDTRWAPVARILEREALLAELPVTARAARIGLHSPDGLSIQGGPDGLLPVTNTALALDVARAYLAQ